MNMHHIDIEWIFSRGSWSKYEEVCLGLTWKYCQSSLQQEAVSGVALSCLLWICCSWCGFYRRTYRHSIFCIGTRPKPTSSISADPAEPRLFLISSITIYPSSPSDFNTIVVLARANALDPTAVRWCVFLASAVPWLPSIFSYKF